MVPFADAACGSCTEAWGGKKTAKPSDFEVFILPVVARGRGSLFQLSRRVQGTMVWVCEDYPKSNTVQEQFKIQQTPLMWPMPR